ncbi:MAG: hypothetical protein R3C51_04615 [Parvularculaceae bacterium]
MAAALAPANIISALFFIMNSFFMASSSGCFFDFGAALINRFNTGALTLKAIIVLNRRPCAAMSIWKPNLAMREAANRP